MQRPVVLKALIVSMLYVEGTWPSLLLEDFRFMWFGSDSLHCSMPDPFDAPQDWFKEIMFAPKRFKSLFEKVCVQSESSVPVASAMPAPVTSDRFVCSECDKWFHSRQQLLSHAFVKHDYRNPLRARILTFECLACNLYLHSRNRVFKHVARKGGINPCAFHYMEVVSPIDAEALDGIKEKKPAANMLLMPPVQIVGPL